MLILQKKDTTEQIIFAYPNIENGRYLFIEDEEGLNVITLEEMDYYYHYLGET